jgi:hypothetical protein
MSLLVTPTTVGSRRTDQAGPGGTPIRSDFLPARARAQLVTTTYGRYASVADHLMGGGPRAATLEIQPT